MATTTYVPRVERLIQHLGMKHNAELLAVTDMANGDQLALYAANGRSFVVQFFRDGRETYGYEIFIQASASLSDDTVLARLDAYIAGTI